MSTPIDPAILDKIYAEMERDMAKLLFPNGRSRHVEDMDMAINNRPPPAGSMIERRAITFWKTERS